MSQNAISFGIAMAFMCSVLFVITLHSWLGICIGIGFGFAFAAGFDPEKKDDKDCLKAEKKDDSY